MGIPSRERRSAAPTTSRMRAILVAVIRCIVLPTGVLALLLACSQRHLIYFPRPYSPEQARGDAPRVVPLPFITGEGPQTCFYVAPRAPRAAPPERLWMLFGGNGMVALDWQDFLRGADPASGFLLVDYPGYGASTGLCSPATIRDASDGAAVALAAHLHLDDASLRARLGVVGHSLGCAAALQFAARHPLQRAVLIAPFTSMLAMARLHVGWPLCEVLVHRFDNRARLAEVFAAGAPAVTILHGDQDEVIPVAMARALAAEFPAITYIELPGGTHNGIMGSARPEICAAMSR